MMLRRPMLHGALVALGLVVLVGAVATVGAGDRWTGDVIGSVITSILAIGAVVGLSFIVDREKLREGTFAALLAVAATWALLLGMLWIRFLIPMASWQVRISLENSLSSVIFTLFPAAGALMLAALPAFRIAGRALAYVAGIALVFFLLQILLPLSGRQVEAWLVTGMGIYGFGALICVCLVGLERGDRAYYRWLGVLAAVVGLGAVIVDVWGNFDRRNNPAYFIGAMLTLAGVAAHAVTIRPVKLTPGQKWLRWATLACGWVTAALVIGAIATDAWWWLGSAGRPWAGPPRMVVESLARIAGAFGIITAGLTTAMMVVWRLNRKKEFIALAPLPADLQALTIVCPGCGMKAEVATGKSACAGCGLRFEIKIEEPRCQVCGYLLYRETTGRCSECGTATGEAARGFEVESATVKT